jgi:hypothetical protein
MGQKLPTGLAMDEVRAISEYPYAKGVMLWHGVKDMCAREARKTKPATMTFLFWP